jgi:hypothetical protein
MTHTLHRKGTVESLSRDFVFLTMPSKDINHAGSAKPLKRFFQLALETGCVKIGDCRSGNEFYQGSVDKVIENVEDRAVIHAVFDDRDQALQMLRKLKEADLGLSVVVSGLLDVVDGCCHESGLQRHTVEHSMGIWGQTDRLPPDHILHINTMCGHGMVTVSLINDVIDQVKLNRITAEEGAERLFQTCMCGIFNTSRAAELLRQIVDDAVVAT